MAVGIGSVKPVWKSLLCFRGGLVVNVVESW